MSAAARQSPEPWRRRLYIPNYQVREAARYADIAPQTVAKWHSNEALLSKRDDRAALSYVQLVEVAVVAALRKSGLSLRKIREARAYVSKELTSEYPFAEYRFKTNGKELWMDYDQIDKRSGADKLLAVNRRGQLAWKDFIDRRLKEFEYEDGGVAIKWHLAGESSPVVIDPRVAFGAPTVLGTPTWAIKGRWEAGENIGEIAEDFGLTKALVKAALKFEGIGPGDSRSDQWVH